MNQRWTLHVENFARIKDADIEISPLMCFIGDNNSGKSYIMSLLWGIIANGKMMFRKLHDDFSVTELYNQCNSWMLSNIGKVVVITDEIEQMYIGWFNELLAKYKSDLLERIFNYKVEASNIEIRNFKRAKKLSVYLWDATKHSLLNYGQDIKVMEMHLDETDISTYHFLLCWLLLMEDLTRINKSIIYGETPIYLPASRTGFLLTYSQIASKSIRSYFSSRDDTDAVHETLTAPYIQFLQLLINLKNSPNNVQDEMTNSLIQFLNCEIINGKVALQEDRGVIRYHSDDMVSEIPMSLTSSVVTEVASLLLLLKTRLPLQLVIIEEPEAHLHPFLQKKIAQLLVRFVHSGVPIWITTHSDTIIQHFNNMIKLNNRLEHEREELLERFNYTKEDLLSIDEIELYQFIRGKKFTIIDRPSVNKYGFIVDSFNKAIDELTQEILAFQEDD